VGDIHGEISKLRSLVHYIKAFDSDPNFVFIGDYIDKGEDAKTTLDFLVSLEKDHDCTFLMGNHEYCWLNASSYEEYLLRYGAKNTMDALGLTNLYDTQKLLLNNYGNFFSSLRHYYLCGSYIITHSGIPPDLYAVEDLDSIDSKCFLFNRYPFIMQEVFFQSKYKVIFGHTGFFEPYVDDYKIGIDTAACYLESQPLTSFCIETETFINSERTITELNAFKKDSCANIVRTKPWRIND